MSLFSKRKAVRKLSKKVLVSGTFDPPTLGHNDIIRKCSDIFDDVIVCVFRNAEKSNMFSEEQRLFMLSELVRENGYRNVHTDVFGGYVADYARANEIHYVARGLRGIEDIEYEMFMANVNKSYNDSLETIFFPCLEQHRHISSTAASRAISNGGSLDGLLCKSTLEIISSILK